MGSSKKSISRNKRQQQQQEEQQQKSGRRFIYLDASRFAVVVAAAAAAIFQQRRVLLSSLWRYLCALHSCLISRTLFHSLLLTPLFFYFFSFWTAYVSQSAADKRTRCELLPFLHWGPLKYFSCKRARRWFSGQQRVPLRRRNGVKGSSPFLVDLHSW